MGLARQFVDRIGGGMAQADTQMGLVRQDGKTSETHIEIPDGTELIFQVRVDTHLLQGDIVALKDEGELFLSLRDFFATLGFPIGFNSEQGKAEGWFIRENRRFAFDAKTGKVQCADKSFTFSPATVRARDDDWLVARGTLETWFDMRLSPDFGRQSLTLESKIPLPLQERDIRRSRRIPGDQNLPPVRLPRRDPDYRIADVPFVDVSVTGTQRRNRYGDPWTRALSYSVLASGDLAAMTARSHIGGNLREGPTSVRASLERSAEDPALLGPLKARQFGIGDIRTVDLPIVNSGAQEQGVFVTNRKKGQAVTFATTEIGGDAQPAWDVELYRGDQLVGFQTVDETGRYTFPEVRLLSGANNFRLVFYGPNGEVDEERSSVPVDLDALESGQGFYDVSLTRNDTITYQKFQPDLPDSGAPHLAARFEKAIGESMVASAGLRTRQEGERRKTYAVSGISTLIEDTFVNANAAYDLDGEAAAELIARRDFGRHRASARTQINTEGFSPDSSTENPPVFTAETALSGPLTRWKRHQIGYALESQYSEHADGESSAQVSQNFNAALGPYRLNNTVVYEKRLESGTTENNIEITDRFSAMAVMGRDRYRLGGRYEIRPDPGMQSALISWMRKYGSRLNSEVEIERLFKSSLTEVGARLSWTHENVSISPRLEYATDGKFVASIGARMGLARNPRTGDVQASGHTVASYGGLSAHVFIDNDGDGVFGGGDEPAPGVKVAAIQSRQSALTGADGIAFLSNLPEAQPTDITIDRASFPDPYLIQASEGFSTLPRPGRVAEGAFALHRSGEIDGTVTLSWPEGKHSAQPAAGLRIYLYDGSGRKVMFTKAAYDGFYLFSLIPPGTYSLIPDAQDLRLLGAESPMPRKVTIGYDGTVLTGIDMRLTGAENPVTVAVAEDFDAFVAANAESLSAGVAEAPVLVSLGAYRSRLSMALVWYRLKSRYAPLVADTVLAVRPSEILPDAEGNYVLRLKPASRDLEALRRRCRAIAARGIGCGIEILPGGMAGNSAPIRKSPT